MAPEDPTAPRLPSGHYTGCVDARLGGHDLRLLRTRYELHHRAGRHAHATSLLCLPLDAVCEDRYGSRTLLREPGEPFLCPAGVEHAQHYPRAGSFLVVELSLERAREWELPDERAGPLDLRGDGVRSAARRLIAEYRYPDALSPLAMEGLVLELLVEGLRGRRRAAERHATWLDEVEALLRDDLTRTPRMDELAAAVGRHPNHVGRAFRQRHGCSVGEHLRRLRVDEAARLLRETRLPLPLVAQRVGFADQSHLTRTFRRLTGTTPARYRRAVG